MPSPSSLPRPRDTSPWWEGLVESLRFQRDAIDARTAVRRSLGVAICLFGGHLLGVPGLGMMASVGALLTAAWASFFVGRTELLGTLLAALTLGAFSGLGDLVYAHGWLIVPAATASAVIAGFLAFIPQPWPIFGVALAFGVVVVGAVEPFPGSPELRAFAVSVGGLVQVALLLCTWPLEGLRPERRALRAMMRDVARQLEDTRSWPVLLPPTTALIDVEVALAVPQPFAKAAEIAKVRAAHAHIVRLRRTVAAFRTHTIRVEERGAKPLAEAAREARLAAARLCRLALRPAGEPKLERARAELRSACAAWPEGTGGGERARVAALSLAARLDALAAGRFEPTSADDEPAPRPPSLLLQLRNRVAVLHAIRMGLGVGVAVLIAELFALPRGHWVGLVVLFVLRPGVADTSSRIMGRAVGTALGLMLALPLSILLQEFPFLQSWAAVLTAGATIYTFSTSYFWFSTSVSAFVCLVMSFSGDSYYELAAARTLDFSIGLAVVAAVSRLAPRWEGQQTGAFLAKAVSSQIDYLTLAFERLAGHDVLEATTRAESVGLKARLASQASLRKIELEPTTRGGRWRTHGRDVQRALEAMGHASLLLHAALDDGMQTVRCGCPSVFREALPALHRDLLDVLSDQHRELPELSSRLSGLVGRHVEHAAPDDLVAGAMLALRRLRQVIEEAARSQRQ